ncbi:MAG: DUF3899 domain-containing protein [Clostridia bacterium]|nr:DUF3899 domain-containing protein [Clostridia bacterium]
MSEEKDSRKAKLVSYGVTLAVGLGLMLAVLSLGGYWRAETPMDRARILCDGFSVPGALLMLIAGVLFASGQGAFNGVLFGLKRTKEILLPFLPSEYVPYREFIKRRAEKKKSGYGCLFFVGLGFFTVGIVLLIRFDLLYP